MTTAQTTCCIAGGGPAGMMLGFLLARAGVEVTVLEKHADFLRDFRGDTIHPSTLEVMAELGLLDALLRLPHQDTPRLVAQVGDTSLTIADFTALPTRYKAIVLMPQWDFLDFLARQGRMRPTFHLHMRAEVIGLLEEAGRVVGVRAMMDGTPLQVRADLVVGADGRQSVARTAAGLAVDTLGAPMDVLWFRLSRAAGDPARTMGRFDAGRILVLLDRGDSWQCGFVIAKGSAERLRAEGLPTFRTAVARMAPFGAGRVEEIRSWDDVKLLTVKVDRLRRWWRPGLLCIGDAAHAMSPIGGVGINLAIQDAVATANALAVPLRARRLRDEDLARVQARRQWPTRVTQRLQVLAQRRIIAPALSTAAPRRPPWLLTQLLRVPFVRRLPARLIGLGVRPEHVESPDVAPEASARPRDLPT
jgi:2-polyprenyl-6-methoxyphenol hydroxylase-like FAD-dependent oxidoreductase